MAEVLARRGTRAMLFRGVDGLDELTTTDLSAVYDVKDGTVRETHLDPGKHGLGRVKPEDLAGGNAPYNAAIARRILDGEPGPQRDVVLLNAGAALKVAGFASTLDGEWRPRLVRSTTARQPRPLPDGLRPRTPSSIWPLMILSDRDIRTEIEPDTS
jgi:anthranilate phosphoribosyltransferase